MKSRKPIRAPHKETGIALLISIFILLLISVVAIALIVSSGTESALAGNYRSSTAVYYAALSGLEEARSRLVAKNPSSFKNTSPGFIPSPGVTMAIGSIAYVLNPSPDPAFNENQGNLLTLPPYQDLEYDSEFGQNALNTARTNGTVKTTPSVWNTNPLNAANGTMAGPLYKWVRINPVSEVSLKLNVSPFTDPNDTITPIFYDGSQLNVSGSGQQVFEVTSLAVLPNGSQKLLQYLVTPATVTFSGFPNGLTFSAGLTLAGSSATFTAPASNTSYYVSGVDLTGIPGCTTGAAVHAIGVFGGADPAAVKSGIPTAMQSQYVGTSPPADVVDISALVPSSVQTPSQLNAIVQTIIQNADVTLPSGPVTYPLPTVTGSALTSLGMSSSTPLTVVVNGNLDVTGWTGTGYGLLLVIGKFTYDPATTWNGIVLVVGQGVVNNTNLSQFQQINGAMFVAKTRDTSGNLLPDPTLGAASVVFNSSMQGNGIRYSSCWVQRAQPTGNFKILSFHEIPQ